MELLPIFDNYFSKKYHLLTKQNKINKLVHETNCYDVLLLTVKPFNFIDIDNESENPIRKHGQQCCSKSAKQNQENIVVLIKFDFLCIIKILEMTTFKSIWLWWGNTFLC